VLAISALFVVISFVFSMMGIGGGLVYVPLLVIIGFNMKEASTLSLFAILVSTSVASINYIKSKRVNWSLFAVMEPTTAIAALIGGFIAVAFSERILRFLLVCILIIVGVLTLFSGKRVKAVSLTCLYVKGNAGDSEYFINLPIVLSLCGLAGFIAGMIGIAGGVFKVPLMVTVCGVPMNVAIATSAAMVAVTAAFGLLGHLLSAPSVNWFFIIVFGLACLIGGFLGSRCALKLRREILEVLYFLLMVFLAFWVALISYTC